jgi:hypothetical protein
MATSFDDHTSEYHCTLQSRHGSDVQSHTCAKRHKVSTASQLQTKKQEENERYLPIIVDHEQVGLNTHLDHRPNFLDRHLETSLACSPARSDATERRSAIKVFWTPLYTEKKQGSRENVPVIKIVLPGSFLSVAASYGETDTTNVSPC